MTNTCVIKLISCNICGTVSLWLWKYKYTYIEYTYLVHHYRGDKILFYSWSLNSNWFNIFGECFFTGYLFLLAYKFLRMMFPRVFLHRAFFPLPSAGAAVKQILWSRAKRHTTQQNNMTLNMLHIIIIALYFY